MGGARLAGPVAVSGRIENPLELTLNLDDAANRTALFGAGDGNLKLIRGALGVHVTARDSKIKLTGNSASVHRAAQVLRRLQRELQHGRSITAQVVTDSIAACAVEEAASKKGNQTLDVYGNGAPIAPRTDGQREYVEAMISHDLTVCLGPAGTGKTYLAVAVAVSMLKRGAIQRIILVRPAVAAGEKLGYLPGDMQAKVNPYLRPLFDAMHDMMSFDQLKRFMQNDVVEVVPLAFMRGRTLNRAAVILDEAQNTTPLQMLMFLTRMGHESKMIVTGDDSQVDLESGPSGLFDAVRRLRKITDIAIIRLLDADIVRHKLVQRIVNAYDRNHAAQTPRRRIREPSDSRTLATTVDETDSAVDDDFDPAGERTPDAEETTT